MGINQYAERPDCSKSCAVATGEGCVRVKWLSDFLKTLGLYFKLSSLPIESIPLKELSLVLIPDFFRDRKAGGVE